ncbi:DUF397 domain-containing protein [Micromonospora sp. WMMD1082]|uniref:DUF397 domain-containing protein n=1 Tax=Micromonospora sp. WMMD1082 TaxID=3016104 RepID=UPI00241597EF|nr:DUF397 domain-containing protein [Micromonospora sp. WMMD1082]MDG4795500.1 DUF397 domain-containing protein [Micromonospora sp. WMMD1082]
MSRISYDDWRTSSRSDGGGNCVEVSTAVAGHAAVRDSKDREGGILEFDRSAWRRFIGGIREGRISM